MNNLFIGLAVIIAVIAAFFAGFWVGRNWTDEEDVDDDPYLHF